MSTQVDMTFLKQQLLLCAYGQIDNASISPIRGIKVNCKVKMPRCLFLGYYGGARIEK